MAISMHTLWFSLVGSENRLYHMRLLLDSRVVDLTRSYHPIFVPISSFKP